jgi:hypothetical protein
MMTKSKKVALVAGILKVRFIYISNLEAVELAFRIVNAIDDTETI